MHNEMIGSINSTLKISESRLSEDYPRLLFKESGEVDMRDLIPNFRELWDYTKEKVLAAGAVEFVIFNTKKVELFRRSLPNDLVAIVVPTFNLEAFINETLLSLKAQSYSSLHIIIVDDFSTDSTRRLILEFMSAETDNLAVSFAQIPVNIGNPGFTRNFGLFNLLMPHTDYIGFMDGDDLYAVDNALSKLVGALQINRQAIAAVGDYDWITEIGELLAAPDSIKKDLRGQYYWKNNRDLTWSNLASGRLGPFHLQCLMVKRNAPYIPYRPLGEDAEYYALLFAECAANHRELNEMVVPVPALIAHYRKRKASISQKKGSIAYNPPARLQEIQERSTIVPPYYYLAKVPEKYITRKMISQWVARRLTTLFFRDLRSQGLRQAFVHVKVAFLDSRIRKIDLIRIPIAKLFLMFMAINLISSLKDKVIKKR
ncbi:MAG: glycosyltransferase [Pseudomonadales bacterium]|nr:glycosyltransferase [Pseudomonadales bacterium]